MPYIIPVQCKEPLPLFEESEWLTVIFSKLDGAVRLFREVLLEKGWDCKIGTFDTEVIIDLNVLNASCHNYKDNPVDVLIGYKEGHALLAHVIQFTTAIPMRFVEDLSQRIEYSQKLINETNNNIKLLEITVVLLDEKYFGINEYVLRRYNPNRVFSIVPLTVEAFYNSFFVEGYKRIFSSDL